MAKPGRKPREIPGEKIIVVVPQPLMSEVRLLLLNPTYSKIRYGALSGLLTELLQKWVDEQRVAAIQAQKGEEDGGA